MAKLGVEPWNEPVAPESGDACRRAAIWVWGVAAGELLLTACCFVMFLSIALVPAADLRQGLAENDMPDEQIEQVMQIKPHMAAFAAGYGMLSAIPAVLLAGLAFGVRTGGKWSTITCQVIIVMQMLVVGWITLMAVIAALSMGQLAQFTLALVLLGSLLATLVMTFRHLWRARRLVLDASEGEA